MVVGALRQATLLFVTLLVTMIYLLSSWLKHVISYIRPWRWHKRRLEMQLSQAASYREWLVLAQAYDQIDGRDLWKLEPEAPMYYDHANITARLYQLKEGRLLSDIPKCMRQLRENLSRNIGGIGHPALYSQCLVGTKKLIDQYLEEVILNIDAIAATPTLSLADKEQFLADSRQAYGRSALLLSGGASLGMLHWGVLRCLYDHNLLPLVICGGSIGALFCAVVGVHTDAELGDVLHNPNSINFATFASLTTEGSGRRKLLRLLKHGVLMDVTRLEEFCRKNLGDVTFAEAYQKTGRAINIFLTHTPHKGYPNLLNHLTTPNVLLWSAATAACAQPGMYAPVALMAKDMDGSIVPLLPSNAAMSWSPSKTVHYSLPMDRLSQLFNVNHFIVSQVNPHVVPFLRSIKSSSRFSVLHQIAMLMGAEILHRVKQLAELGWWPKFLAWMQVEVLQQYEGDITIVPRLSLELLRKVLVNPSAKDLAWFAREGERSTWPYLAIIRSHCKIELALHRATLQLREAMQTPRASPEPFTTRQASASPLSRRRATDTDDATSSPSAVSLPAHLPASADSPPGALSGSAADGSPPAGPTLASSARNASPTRVAFNFQQLNNQQAPKSDNINLLNNNNASKLVYGVSRERTSSPRSPTTPTPPDLDEHLPPRRRAVLTSSTGPAGDWREAALNASGSSHEDAAAPVSGGSAEESSSPPALTTHNSKKPPITARRPLMAPDPRSAGKSGSGLTHRAAGRGKASSAHQEQHSPVARPLSHSPALSEGGVGLGVFAVGANNNGSMEETDTHGNSSSPTRGVRRSSNGVLHRADLR